MRSGGESIMTTKLDSIFNHLHTHPEVSWNEVNTTKYVEKILEENGCRVKTFDDCTGVIGEIGKGKPVVALRADMDALWQQVNGEFRANHSCGHDAHMTMVLGVMLALVKLPKLPKGTIRFIFQPAEEKGAGALKMVDKGVADDINYLYGVHLRPIQEAENGKASPAIIHGAARVIEGKIVGEDSHGARPHLGPNAIDVGAALVGLVNGIHSDPMVPHSIKMTKFLAGGESANIIPGSAEFSVDLRAQTNEAIEELQQHLENAISFLAREYQVKIELSTEAEIAAAVVNTEAQDFMAEAIRSTIGVENMLQPIVTPGGDDFHFYTLKRPHLKATMLGLGCDLQPGLHHPDMHFRHEAMQVGTDILTNVVLMTMEKAQ
ncbi:MAG TPA: M20 peptidase aminoacylase family protein [Bacillales bacterium]|nr:M20 peptidase aminoacylase family protein [Bacillales bacterium]